MYAYIYKLFIRVFFMKEFDNLTIGELKNLTDDFLKQNSDFKTPEQILKEYENKKA